MRTLQRPGRALWQLHTLTPRLPSLGGLPKYQLKAFSGGQAPCRHLPGVNARSLHPTSPRRQYSSKDSGSEAARRIDLEVPCQAAETGVRTISILPTPKANPEKLSEKLKELLSGDTSWELDPQGDAINAIRYFADHHDAEIAATRIMGAAEKLNHHPHVSHGQYVASSSPLAKSVSFQVMLITCTTHQPRGLGLRDITLAKAIDEVFLPYNDGEYSDYVDKSAKNNSMGTVGPTPDALLAEYYTKHRNEIECAVCKK